MSILFAGIFLLLQSYPDAVLKARDAFIQAAETGQIEQIRAQVGLTDISLTDERGRTALLAAAEKGQREAFAVLLSVASEGLESPRAQLFSGDQSARAKLAFLLLQRARFFNNADRNGVTPLMLAVSHGWIDLVRALVEGGASIDAHDKNGLIPVDYAVRQGQAEIEVYLRQVRKKIAV